MQNAVMVAFTKVADPEREDEFNEWYDKVHAVEALQTDGVLSCRRYKLAKNQMMPPGLPEFLAVYEIDPAVVDTLPKELAERFAAGKISMSDLMAEGMMGIYEILSEPTA